MNNHKLRRTLREKIVKIAYQAQSSYSHVGSCLSCIDILIEVYLNQLKKGDKFILSKGHAALALYVMLKYQKKLTANVLNTYLQENTLLGIHPSSLMPAEIPLATGSLGHGLSFSAGMSLGYKLKDKKKAKNVYCLLSDGECNEGAVWEAALFSSRHNLDNLIAIIDKNRIQAFDRIEEALGDAATADKWLSFGFNVYECNGHDLSDLKSVLTTAKKTRKGKPHMIIAHTCRGKGIKPIEDDIRSNYIVITDELLHLALKELRKL